jgi:hypothetical protein
VRKLNAGVNALFMDEPRNARQKLDVVVFPDSQVLRANPPFRRYRCSFGKNQARATHSPAAEMDQVPVIGKAVGARILAHRRNHDAVGKLDASKAKRRKKFGHAEQMLQTALWMRKLRCPFALGAPFQLRNSN